MAVITIGSIDYTNTNYALDVHGNGTNVTVDGNVKSEEELTAEFGENGWKQLPDAFARRYRFIPAKVEVDEHHVGVYASKTDGHMVKAEHPKSLLHGSPVSASLAAAIMNGKYVNAVPLLPSGTGVHPIWPCYNQTEHGKLDDPVRGRIPFRPV